MSAAVLIMAGGTGGHVYPGLAVARALREAAWEVSWLGTRAGLEARLVPEAGIAIDWISIGGLRGKGPAAWLTAPFRLATAVWQALRVILRRRPVVVLGLGGFVAGPGGVAAWLLRRPLVIHEQNSVAGLTNRLLAPLSREVLEAFPGAFAARRRARAVGNPVRSEIAAVPPPAARYAARSGPLRVLVLGGSQGALALNVTVPRALAALDATVEVWHQSGARTRSQAEAAYRDAGLAVRLEEFIVDMAAAYAWADLVVCRAGALTVSELAAAGVPAVLVPYPWSVDDHQRGNAAYLADAGAARLLDEADLSAASLSALLTALAADREQLLAMAVAARRLARPDATASVADACLRAAGLGEGP